jgi:hypothetical protein
MPGVVVSDRESDVNDGIHMDEFNRVVAGISTQLARLERTTLETLIQATKTNGRVDVLERVSAIHEQKLDAADAVAVVLAQSPPVTKRDLWVVAGTLTAAAALMKWVPFLANVGQGAP